MSYKVGDLVICCEGHHSGSIGIITVKTSWYYYKNAPQMIIVLSDGKKKKWYEDHVRLIDEKDRFSKGKGRS